MKLKLNYIGPGMTSHAGSLVSTTSIRFEEWLDWMVEGHPDTIFFFTTETTDIFEEERGRCGDRSPAYSEDNPRITFCRLPHGHPGWHKGDDGSEWVWTKDQEDKNDG